MATRWFQWSKNTFRLELLSGKRLMKGQNGDPNDGSNTRSVGWCLNLRASSVSVCQVTLCTAIVTMMSVACYAAIVTFTSSVEPVEQSEAIHGAEKYPWRHTSIFKVFLLKTFQVHLLDWVTQIWQKIDAQHAAFMIYEHFQKICFRHCKRRLRKDLPRSYITWSSIILRFWSMVMNVASREKFPRCKDADYVL